MDTPLRQGARTRDRPTWTPRPLAESYIGRSLADGRFMIRQPIAEGGMSLVFLADDRQDGRPVAIKICRDDDPDSSIGRRFAWESRVLANLQHPNLVSVLATGETLEGNPYMVQPYLGGDTLRARLDSGPLGWRVVLEIGVQIADALHALHQAGVIHRDVKPANIIWARHPTQPVWVQLIDLGIAKLLAFEPPRIEGARAIDRRATDVGHVLGTEGYRPPEAASGICTPRFDVFSLGVTLYRLCTGEFPYPDPRPLAEVCPNWDGPDDFEAVIRKAIDLDPERRHASADALRLALEAVRVACPEDDRPRHLFAGCYNLIGVLGSGAKATTYRAYHRLMSSRVAIKILNPKAQADRDECLRFELEAKILRAVHHPNLPEVYELNTYAGQLYMAMELCPGKRAREYTLQTTCLAPAEVLRIGEQLASALAALHEAGVVYRDLTYDNVLIHFLDREPQVKLIDFNASLIDPDRFFAHLGEPPPEQPMRPSRDLDLRSMRYAAPEVLAGAPWSEASDVFALGMLLYQLLTGQLPFYGAKPDRPATPPRCKDCPENLSTALLAALELDPKDRATLTDLVEFLELAREEIKLAASLAREVPTPIPAEKAVDAPTADPKPAASTPAPEQAAVLAPAMTAAPPESEPTSVVVPSPPRPTWWPLAAALIVGMFVGGSAVFALSGLARTRPSTADETTQPALARAPLAADVPAQESPEFRPPPVVTQEPPPTPSSPSPASAVESPAPSAATPAPAREPSAPRARSPRPPRLRTFSTVMTRLAPKIRDCARETDMVEKWITAQVRFKGTSIDSVRVQRMSKEHPFALCVDKIVRAAAPLPDENPVEDFTFTTAEK